MSTYLCYYFNTENKNLDFFIDITQHIQELESIVNVLKTSIIYAKDELEEKDVENSIEIIYAKVQNIRIYIEKCIEEINS